MIHWHPSQEKKYRDSSQDEAADGCSMPSFIPSRSARCSPEVQQSMQLPSTSEHDEIRYTECDQVNRPRLTQHQHFGLEEYFLSHPKPNTKIKQQLATKYGLSLTRVSDFPPFDRTDLHCATGGD